MLGSEVISVRSVLLELENDRTSDATVLFGFDCRSDGRGGSRGSRRRAGRSGDPPALVCVLSPAGGVRQGSGGLPLAAEICGWQGGAHARGLAKATGGNRQDLARADG